MIVSGYVYILASEKVGTLYTGVTNDLTRRISEHKIGKIKGFTSKYGVKRLVYYEYFYNIEDAIRREKNIKDWQRSWKIQLIEKENPNWEDLFTKLIGELPPQE